MKKYLSIILALSMTVALLCNSALAAGTPQAGADTPDGFSQEVPVKIQQIGGETIHKYSVDIEFGDMVFTYTTDDKQWVPDEQNYKSVSRGTVGWAGNGNLTIYNHSDLAIAYTIIPTVTNTTHDNLNIETSKATGTIVKCEAGDALWTHSDSAVISVVGTPSGLREQVVLGEVDVVISAVTP